MNAVLNSPTADYFTADLALADRGRKRVSIAEDEMPGLLRRGAQGVAQYFLDAGSRRRCDHRDRNAGMSRGFSGH